MMNEIPGLLEQGVRRAARRLALQRAFRAGLAAGTVVLAALAAATVATLVVPLSPVSIDVTLAAVGVVTALVTGLLMLVRPVEPITAARLLDLRGGLEERASTALEVGESGAVSTLARRLLDDAASHVEAINLRAVFPWRLPRWAWVMPALVLFLLLWPSTLRGIAIPGTPAHRTQQAIKREGTRLEQFARSLQSRARSQRVPQTRRVAPQVRDLGVRMQQERLERAEALARIGELSRQIEEARREIDGRLRSQAPQREGAVPQELFRRQALQQQVRQLRELTTRLRQNPEAASTDALQRLGEITQSGEGDQPAQVRRQLERAREQLQQGNAAGAGESLGEALRELEGLESMLADAEGLRSAQQQLERSQRAIASGSAGRREGDAAEDQSQSQGRPDAPGENAPEREPGADALPPEGPHEGTTPGQGRVREKMGEPTPRLEATRTPERLRGAQSEGPVSSAEVVGGGRQGAARRQAGAVSPAIVAQADRAMENARTPGRYRALVRRYFERLAKLR